MNDISWNWIDIMENKMGDIFPERNRVGTVKMRVEVESNDVTELKKGVERGMLKNTKG